MAEGVKQFTFFESYYRLCYEDLPDGKGREMMDAIMAYMFCGTYPSFDDQMMLAVFHGIQPNLDASVKKSENGRLSAGVAKQTKANESKQKLTEANESKRKQTKANESNRKGKDRIGTDRETEKDMEKDRKGKERKEEKTVPSKEEIDAEFPDSEGWQW